MSDLKIDATFIQRGVWADMGSDLKIVTESLCLCASVVRFSSFRVKILSSQLRGEISKKAARSPWTTQNDFLRVLRASVVRSYKSEAKRS